MRFSVPLLCVAAAFAAIPVAAARAEVSDDEVVAAIERGVAYLFSQQKPNGLFTETGETNWEPAGRPIKGADDCWVMVGLAFAAQDPNDERMKRAFEAMIKLDLDMTYAVAPRVIALCRLYHKLRPEPKELAKAVIQKDLQWLIKAQGPDGQWNYDSLENQPAARRWDFSNTQMAILAFHEAILAGFEPPPEPLMKTQNLYVSRQLEDGGWNYGSRPGFQAADNPNGSYGSMTAAAVASLFITRDYLFAGIGCPCSGGRSKLRPNRVDVAIDRGLAWLGKEYVVNRNPRGNENRWTLYWLYSCERVGLAAGYKYFGTHDWFNEGAEYLVRHQGGGGSWHLGGEHPSDTVYAICFLVKGRAPILMNKLQFDGQWNNHPRDVANLARHVGAQKEQAVQWQIINLDAPVQEWHDSPILYVSAETLIPLTDQQKAKLREYTDTGGTILFEASCGNRQVRLWWERTAKEIWPEWEFRKIEREHPIFETDLKISRPLPLLMEMNDGMRSIIFFSPTDVSCHWNTMAVAQRRELFDFGANLYAYATDKGPLRARLAAKRRVADKYRERVLAGTQNPLAVARVKHGGDYYVGRNYKPLEILGKDLASSARLTLTDAGEKAPAELKADRVQVAHVTGRKGFSMIPEQITALQRYLAGGGFLLAEAAMGDPRFDADLRPVLSQMGLQMKLLAGDDPLLTGRMEGASGYSITTVKFRPALMARRVGRQVPDLYGIYQDERLVGVYSPFDLSYAQTGYEAWGCRGYDERDAAALLTNIFLLVSTRPAPGTEPPPESP